MLDKTLAPKLVRIGAFLFLLAISGCASKRCVHMCYFNASSLADFILDGGTPQIQTDCSFEEGASNPCFKDNRGRLIKGRLSINRL